VAAWTPEILCNSLYRKSQKCI